MLAPNRPVNLAFEFHPLFTELQDDGLRFRNAIVWHFGHGMHNSRRFSGRYETILWYTKGDEYTFNLNAVRVPQKYPGKTYYKGEKKGQPSGNPLGKNPGDVWTDIPNVKANHIEKAIEHPCQFPIALARRLVLALTDPTDLVIDPFAGVGTTLAAAALTRRRSAGCDLLSEFVTIARSRVKLAARGKLAFRAEKPVHQPDKGSKLVRIPDSFWNDQDGDFRSAVQSLGYQRDEP
jgi:adenine-specific DNA-methyltransferase